MKKLIFILAVYLPIALGQVNISLGNKAIKNNTKTSVSKNENLKIKSEGYLQAYIQKNLFPLKKRDDYSISSGGTILSIPLSNFKENSVLIFAQKKAAKLEKFKKIVEELSRKLAIEDWENSSLHPINQSQKTTLKIIILNYKASIIYQAKLEISKFPIEVLLFTEGRLLKQGEAKARKISIRITNYNQKTQHLHILKIRKDQTYKTMNKKLNPIESFVLSETLKDDAYYMIFYRDTKKQMKLTIKKIKKMSIKKIFNNIPDDKIFLILRTWKIVKKRKIQRLFNKVIGWKISAS